MILSNSQNFTVLVVEDDVFIREMIVDHLKECACHVVEASTGEAAMEALRVNDTLDGVFTDIRLGGRTDGWDVGEASRASHPGIPVVYTSAATLLPERPVPGSVFIAKPYDPANVLGTIRKLHKDA